MMRHAGKVGMLLLAAGALARALPAQGQTQVVFSRPPTAALIVSSWVDPEGSDSDMYAYDEFTIAADAAITEVRWRGGYTLGATYGLVTDFSVTIFESIPGGLQPHVGNPQLEDTSPIYLARYRVGGNAGETSAGTFGGTTMYDYSFVLPAPFQATAGVKYWLRIEASQSTYPDWGIAAGTGGDGQHFRFSTGAAMFQFAPNDTAFTLLAPAGPTFTTATFDFDTGTPPLSTGQNMPLDQTSGGVTAHFSAPAGSGNFSLQTDASTQYHMSQFSGHYLWPNSLGPNVLDIKFSQQLSNIMLTFATADFQQVEVPTTIQLTAYEDSAAAPAVGSATAHGTYAGDTMPMGTLSFDSGGMPFNLVRISIPYQPQGASVFLVDNITAAATTLTPTDTPTVTETPTHTPTPTLTPTATRTPIPCVGDCGPHGTVTVGDLITMVNVARGDTDLSACSAGDATGDLQITIDEIFAAVKNALNGCGSGQ